MITDPELPDDPYEHLDLPGRAWSPPPADDTESAFWRDVREADRVAAGAPPATPHRPVNLDREPADTPVPPRPDWFVRERELAETVGCADCLAPVGVTCQQKDGTPLRKFPAHIRRLTTARKAAQP